MKKIKFFLVCVAVTAGIPFSSIAKDWSKEPLIKLEQAAKNGDAEAQHTLGRYYEIGLFNPSTGIDFSVDYTKAVFWYKKALKKPNAQYEEELAYIYFDGNKNFKRDLKQSAHWFEESARHGDINSQYMIGKLYTDGSGVPKNIKKAFEWFKKSAQQGSADAIYALSTFYFDGDGVERDYIKAMALALIAKKNGVSTPQWADDIIMKSSEHLSIDEQNRAQSLTLNDII
jgi:uncharacterized protein